MIHSIHVGISFFTFPGGEEHVRLTDHMLYNVRNKEEEIVIGVKLKSSSDTMRLLLAVDAIRRQFRKVKIHLFMPYVPYARQDRVCNQGESLSIKVFCDLINSLEFESVRIFDPHSDVTPALLNRCKVDRIEQYISKDIVNDKVIVCPDAGAIKRTYEFAKKFNITEIVFANKKRNVMSGEIEGIDINVPHEYKEKKFLIVDDICDGGRTFIELGKKLKEQGVKHIELLVTHGIFSKGLSVFNGIIDHIYCTDSYYDYDEKNTTALTTFNLF